MTISTLPASEESRKGFYPTPENLTDRMLDGITLWGIQYILEPSAGTGNLIDAVARRLRYDNRKNISVDAIEIDPHIRAVLKHDWCGGRADEIAGALSNREISDSVEISLRYEREKLDAVDVHVVHDDFMTFDSAKSYDLCIMNPPFQSGDAHLLKAIDVMRNGGKIRCLLNAETLRNPCTNQRKELVRKLEELGAQIEYVSGAFSNAERRTDVETAVVKIDIPEPEFDSSFYSRMKKAAEEKIVADPELAELITADYLQAGVQRYNVERDAAIAFYREWQGLSRYVKQDLKSETSGPLVSLQCGNKEFEINAFLKVLRLKFWKALFGNNNFVGKLTSELRDKYRKEVSNMAAYDFTMFNIQEVYRSMQEAMSSGIEGAVLKLFDSLTVDCAYWDDCKTTIHYYSGWKTNKAHKIGPKVIIPTRGLHKWYVSSGECWVDERECFNKFSDIEKALDYLSAKPLDDGYDLRQRIHDALEAGQTRNIELKYFRVDLFKKGTAHIKWKPEALPIVDRLNIFGSQKHGWLPPNYGKRQYSDMDRESRAVVDSFHGTGKDGSGAAAYAEVLKRADYYLSAPARSLPALTAGG